MFLVRSAFWLTLAFMIIAPSAGGDAGHVARSAGEGIVHLGAEAATAALDQCAGIECTIGRALIANAVPERGVPPRVMAEAPPPPEAPEPERDAFPPARPAWAY